MAKTVKPTIETGAMTLVLLVKYYKSQMIALLLKNGVTVPRGASDQQIAMLMANLLKISKSYFVDLNAFIQNPKVIQVLAGGITETAQYFKMSGKGYMNIQGADNLPTTNQFGFPITTTSTTETSETSETPEKKGFWSDLNFGNLFSQAINAFGQYNTNQSNVAIAKAHAQSQQAGAVLNTETGSKTKGSEGGKKEDDDKGASTTTVVVLSLLGIAVVGTIIYFVAKPKK